MITPHQEQALEELVTARRLRTYARLLEDRTLQVVIGDLWHTAELSVAPSGEVVVLDSRTLGRRRELAATAAAYGGLLVLASIPGVVLFALDERLAWDVPALEVISRALLVAGVVGIVSALAYQWLDPLLTPDPSGGASHSYAGSSERWEVGAWVRIEEDAFRPVWAGDW